MAFALTLPLVGLEPRNFSALSIRLHCETIYESLCVSAQNSPNSCVFLNTDSNEAGGSGSGYATPGFKSDQKASQSSKNYSAEIERQRKEKVNNTRHISANNSRRDAKRKDIFSGGQRSSNHASRAGSIKLGGEHSRSCVEDSGNMAGRIRFGGIKSLDCPTVARATAYRRPNIGMYTERSQHVIKTATEYLL